MPILTGWRGADNNVMQIEVGRRNEEWHRHVNPIGKLRGGGGI